MKVLLGPDTFYQQFQECWESKYEAKDCHEETTDLTITIWWLLSGPEW